MKLAKGEYIGFLDADGDKFTKDALKHFNDTIIKSDFPDMVIGRQKKVDLWITHNYANAKRLSNSKKIEPHNKWIIWTMSLMNKVFSRKKILDLSLEMPLLSYASDGAFVLPFAYSCDSIVGCPHDIIIYNKRVFFDEYSISQTSSMKTLNDYLKVHDIILKEFLKYSEKYREKYSDDKDKLAEFEEIYSIYLDRLSHRQASILISQFYRFFWRTDLEVIEKVIECLKSFKSIMFLSSWEKLKINNKDLDLDNLIAKKTEMSKSPLVSIAIDNNIKGDPLLQVLYNIHNFLFPSIEVLVSEKSFSKLPDFFKKREYIKTIEYQLDEEFNGSNGEFNEFNEELSESDGKFKNEVLNKANGKFFLYLDRVTLMSLELVNRLHKRLWNSHFDFSTVSVNYSLENDLANGKYYIEEFSSKMFFEKDNYNFFSNKLFRTSFLRENKFKFTENTKNDLLNLYEIGEHSNIKLKLIFDNHTLIKNPYISIIIDDIDIKSDEINDLLESVYKQNFQSFNIFLNENLKSKVSEEYLDKYNLNILKNKGFKKVAITKSKANYGLFIDIPVILKPSFLKEMYFEIEEGEKSHGIEKFSFIAMPIYLINNENKVKSLSTQEISYFYRQRVITPNKSKFFIFDLYTSNKLFDLEYLRENKIYFNRYSEDVLKVYRTSTTLRFYKKLIFTNLYQNELFKKPFKSNKVPSSINIKYKLNKLILMWLYIKKVLDGG